MSSTSSGNRSSLTVRVFLASPGDVVDERARALKTLEDLQYNPLLRGKITTETIAWDKPGAGTPMLASKTPQQAIAEGLPKPSECDIVIVIFWSRMGTPLPANYVKPDGSRYRSGTEWEYQDALQAAEQVGRPQVLVYRRTEVPNISLADPQYEEKRQQWELVETFFAAFRNPDGSIKGGYNPYDTPDTFEKDLALHLQDRIARLLQEHEAKAPPTADAPAITAPEPPLWDGSPFPGLRAFGAADAPIFFGRGRETDGLVARLAKGDRFTVVVGASGSGKSSLVAAGLLPRLLDNAFPGSRDWMQVRFTPGELGDNPLMALCSGFKAGLEAEGRRVRDEAMKLQDHPEAIAELIGLALDGRPDWAEVLLFIDQFEELFTVVDAKYRGSFVDLLERAAKVPRLRMVATLRADFYHYCVEQPALAELLRAGTYPVSAPGVGALFEMIDRPAVRAGLTFEEGLAQRIVDETGSEPGGLPLMAFALSELYEVGHADTVLTHTEYEGFDGVRGAISQRAESTFTSLDADARVTLEQVFRGLLELEEAEAHWVAVRRRARLSDITPTPAAKRLVTAFTEARLLIQDQDQDGEPVVEVAHEALLRNWPRLVNWIDKTADDLRLLRQLEQTTAEWAAHKQSGTYLWPRTRWRQAQAMLKRLQPRLGESEQGFLRRSQRRSVVQAALFAAGLVVATLVGAFFLWSNSRNLAPWEALDVVGFKLGLHAVVEPEMIRVEAGTFWTGSKKEDDPDAESDERPQHEVKVASFWIGKYEVTFDEYDLFARVTGHPKLPDQGWGRGKQPVIHVTWEESVAYAVWLSKATGKNYRLPTEAEWEYAARAGTTTRYWWGDDLGHNHANCAGCGSRWDSKQTAPVGSFEANPFGLYDTAGNVWEWTCSVYRDPYDGSESQCASNEGEERVLRGGSWINNGQNLRSANRNWNDPGNRNDNIGFRLARAQEGWMTLFDQTAILSLRLAPGQKPSGPRYVSRHGGVLSESLPRGLVTYGFSAWPASSKWRSIVFTSIPWSGARRCLLIQGSRVPVSST